jgi:quinol monooxygenase YgiN
MLVAETVREPGCLRYELHQSLEDGRQLIFVESWASEEAWRAHMQGAPMNRFRASGAGELIQDFALYRMSLVADGNRDEAPRQRNEARTARAQTRAPNR